MSNNTDSEVKFRSRQTTPRETPCKLAINGLIAANGDRVGVWPGHSAMGDLPSSKGSRAKTTTEPVVSTVMLTLRSTSALTPKGIEGYLTRPAQASAGFCCVRSAGVRGASRLAGEASVSTAGLGSMAGNGDRK